MIIQNAVYIPELKKYLVSSHRHDYVSCRLKNGEICINDGGHDYLRHSVNTKGKVKDFSLLDTDNFNRIKWRLLWGTRGKDGKKPLKWIRLVDASTTHLRAILKYDEKLDVHLSELQKKVINSILKDRCKIKSANS